MDAFGELPDADTATPAIVLERLSKRYRLARRRHRWLSDAAGGEPSGDEDDDDEGVGDEDDEDVAEEEPTAEEDIWALRDVSLTIPRGTALGIIGGSGAGKTTLLRVIARVAPPTRGRVVVAGRVAPLLGNITSLLEGDFTGRQNVRLLARLYGIPQDIAARQVEQIFEFADIVPFIDTKVKKYSPGLQLRLAFSVMLHLEPDVILADGMLGVGDPEFKVRSSEALVEANRNGLTLLLASSNTSQIRSVCNEVLWLERGRVVGHGAPDELIEQFEAGSGSSQPRRSPGPVGPTVQAKRTRVIEVGFFSMEGLPLEAVTAGQESLIELTLLAPRAASIAWAIEIESAGRPCLRLVQPKPVEADQRGWYRASMYVPADSAPPGAVIRRATGVMVAGSAAGAEESVRGALLRDLARDSSAGSDVQEQRVDLWSWEPQPKRRPA